jgi:hypothetical protein
MNKYLVTIVSFICLSVKVYAQGTPVISPLPNIFDGVETVVMGMSEMVEGLATDGEKKNINAIDCLKDSTKVVGEKISSQLSNTINTKVNDISASAFKKIDTTGLLTNLKSMQRTISEIKDNVAKGFANDKTSGIMQGLGEALSKGQAVSSSLNKAYIATKTFGDKTKSTFLEAIAQINGRIKDTLSGNMFAKMASDFENNMVVYNKDKIETFRNDSNEPYNNFLKYRQAYARKNYIEMLAYSAYIRQKVYDLAKKFKNLYKDVIDPNSSQDALRKNFSARNYLSRTMALYDQVSSALVKLEAIQLLSYAPTLETGLLDKSREFSMEKLKSEGFTDDAIAVINELISVSDTLNDLFNIHRELKNFNRRADTAVQDRSIMNKHLRDKKFLEYNNQCNVYKLSKTFADPKAVWERLTAWAAGIYDITYKNALVAPPEYPSNINPEYVSGSKNLTFKNVLVKTKIGGNSVNIDKKYKKKLHKVAGDGLDDYAFNNKKDVLGDLTSTLKNMDDKEKTTSNDSTVQNAGSNSNSVKTDSGEVIEQSYAYKVKDKAKLSALYNVDWEIGRMVLLSLYNNASKWGNLKVFYDQSTPPKVVGQSSFGPYNDAQKYNYKHRYNEYKVLYPPFYEVVFASTNGLGKDVNIYSELPYFWSDSSVNIFGEDYFDKSQYTNSIYQAYLLADAMGKATMLIKYPWLVNAELATLSSEKEAFANYLEFAKKEMQAQTSDVWKKKIFDFAKHATTIDVNTLVSAAGGAATGASIAGIAGTAFPVVGNLVGAAAGAVVGAVAGVVVAKVGAMVSDVSELGGLLEQKAREEKGIFYQNRISMWFNFRNIEMESRKNAEIAKADLDGTNAYYLGLINKYKMNIADDIKLNLDMSKSEHSKAVKTAFLETHTKLLTEVKNNFQDIEKKYGNKIDTIDRALIEREEISKKLAALETDKNYEVDINEGELEIRKIEEIPAYVNEEIKKAKELSQVAAKRIKKRLDDVEYVPDMDSGGREQINVGCPHFSDFMEYFKAAKLTDEFGVVDNYYKNLKDKTNLDYYYH